MKRGGDSKLKYLFFDYDECIHIEDRVEDCRHTRLQRELELANEYRHKSDQIESKRLWRMLL